MKFGELPLAEAVGAILAHSVRLPDGTLRKGLTLEDSHIARLAAGGMNSVTVARLETGDISENDAARALADAADSSPRPAIPAGPICARRPAASS